MCNFAYFQRPINEVSNQELISFAISFLNGADYNNPDDVKVWEEFKAEIPNRDEEFQKNISYLESVI